MLTMLENKITAFIVLLIISNSSFAQKEQTNDALITDRPDATESSSTVGKGILQIETGGIFESFKTNNIKVENYTFNTSLIRYGLLDNLELRLGWDFVQGVSKINSKKLNNITSGFSPLLLGIKIDIIEEKGAVPEIAFIGHIFPLFSASRDYRPESTAINFRLSLSHTLSKSSSLGYNIGGEWGNDSPEAAGVYSVAYGYSISPKFGIFIELYGDLPEDSSANHYWDTGLTYLVNNNFQLDSYVGTSITKGQDLLLGLGASYRFKKNN
jgi:hypothetical protein